jgi:predicted nuclease of predicted toxin-antitoxin system
LKEIDMKSNPKNKDKIDSKGLKQLLGRIFRARHSDENDPPFLLVKERSVRVDLESVIKAITQNPTYNDNQIVGLVAKHGLKPSDIEIVRAYIHRFGSDVTNPLPIEAHPLRRLLLDENTPQPAMLSLSQSFGWATHVAAEGLAGRDTPDEDIWEFACRHKFQAIVTRDTDFFEIQERRARSALEDGIAVPLLVFVEENISAASLTGIFSSHKQAIERYMSAATCLAIGVSDKTAPKPLF